MSGTQSSQCLFCVFSCSKSLIWSNISIVEGPDLLNSNLSHKRYFCHHRLYDEVWKILMDQKKLYLSSSRKGISGFKSHFLFIWGSEKVLSGLWYRRVSKIIFHFTMVCSADDIRWMYVQLHYKCLHVMWTVGFSASWCKWWKVLAQFGRYERKITIVEAEWAADKLAPPRYCLWKGIWREWNEAIVVYPCMENRSFQKTVRWRPWKAGANQFQRNGKCGAEAENC